MIDPKGLGKIVIIVGIFALFISFLVEPYLNFPCVECEPRKCWTDLDSSKSLILNRIIFLCIIIKLELDSTSSFRPGEWEKAKNSPDFIVCALSGFFSAVTLLKYCASI